MKRLIAFFAAAFLLVSVSLVQVSAMEHAEWNAFAYDDENYEVFGGGIGDFAAEYAIDGDISSAWQKETDIMDSQGNISKECYVALKWSGTMTVESVNMWWRTSTRAVASKDGYVLQTGKKDGGDVVWTDAKGTYSYNCEYLQGDRFACDTFTFSSPAETSYIRVLVKRGVDTERGYSPKLNEIEVTATEISEEVEIPEPPAPIIPDETSSEDVSSEDASSEITSSEESVSSEIISSESTSSETQSFASSESTSSENTQTSTESSSETDPVPSQSDVASNAVSSNSSQQEGGENGGGANIPWIILGVVSLAVIAVSAVIILSDSKKS